MLTLKKPKLKFFFLFQLNYYDIVEIRYQIAVRDMEKSYKIPIIYIKYKDTLDDLTDSLD